MHSLCTLKRAGKLRQLTHLEPIVMNVTRWSSKFTMIDRFFKLEEKIKEMRDPALNRLIPSGLDVEALKRLQKDMKKFDKVTVKLQKSSITLLEVRVIFDETIRRFPSMGFYLAPNAAIVKNPQFEKAICKLLTNSTSDLNLMEAQLLAPFLNNNLVPEVETVFTESDDSDEDDDIIEAAAKRRKVESRYRDLAYIPPTSNVCERLFSAAR